MPDWPVQTEEAVWEEHIYQFQLSDPLFGGPVIDPVTKQGIDNFPIMQLANRTKWLRGQLEDMQTTESLEVTVGSGGDFATINAALTELSRMGVGYQDELIVGTVRLLSGFVMEEQVISNHAGLGWIQIVGTDSETVIARDALTQDYSHVGYAAFGALPGGSLPDIGQLFTMDNSGSATGRHGIVGQGHASPIRVLSGCGVKNAGQDGCRIITGTAWLQGGVVFSSNGRDNLASLSGARVFSGGTPDLSDAGRYGVYAQGHAFASVAGADISGAGEYGVYAFRGSHIDVYQANCRKQSGVDDPDDIRATNGSIIVANAGDGGTNITPNEVTSSGIIFK